MTRRRVTATVMREIQTDMRVRLPEQLGSAEGIAMFMDGSRSNWAVYVPGPPHPSNEHNNGFLVYCPPQWLEPCESEASRRD